MKPSGLRVVAGRFRGRRLSVPAGLSIRPTADRVKEALFSSLGDRVAGARVADCFAGTGSLGIEALSRGAAHAVFVERDPAGLAVLRGNLGNLGLDGAEAPVTIRAQDALHPRTWAKGLLPLDLVLADPPYGQGLGEALLVALSREPALAPHGWLVLEHERAVEPDHAGWRVVARKRYGETMISTFRVATTQETA